jgi:hypothetical protein
VSWFLCVHSSNNDNGAKLKSPFNDFKVVKVKLSPCLTKYDVTKTYPLLN